MCEAPLDADTAFDLLSNERRRHVLCLLAARDGELTLQTVARAVIERMDGVDPDEVDESRYRSVYVSLYQNHVPRLAEAGVVRYDDENQTVALVRDSQTRRLLSLLDAEPDEEWRAPYLAVGGLTGLAAAGAHFGVLPAVVTVWLLPGVVLVVGLALVGLYQYRERDQFGVERSATRLERESGG